MAVVVSAHAARRYIERIEPCGTAWARQRIASASAAIARAAAFGCHSIRLGDRTRLVLDGETVVDVYRCLPGKRLRRHPGPERARRNRMSFEELDQ